MDSGDFGVTRVVVALYQEKGSQFRFRGEQHGGLYEIFCLDRGRAYVRTEGRRFRASPGECFLYLPGRFHQHQATKGHAPHYITVAFTARGGRNLHALGRRRFVLPPALRTLLARVVAEDPRSGRTGAAALQRALLTEFLVEWLRLASSQEPSRHTALPPNRKGGHHGPRGLETYRELAGGEAVAKALSFVEAHLAEDVSLEDAARAAGVSPPYLRLLVRQSLSRSLREELQRMRVQQAKHLLSHTTKNVKEVAVAVGYTNLPAFSRAFRAVEGVAPSAYARTVAARGPTPLPRRAQK
ncbi:MAG: helix-turn-helix transcriptional regulator [Planctomycetes bacterium]|nr:helix-turn-helix transcriptional regulator [Planctomycetota bacterium]